MLVGVFVGVIVNVGVIVTVGVNVGVGVGVGGISTQLNISNRSHSSPDIILIPTAGAVLN